MTPKHFFAAGTILLAIASSVPAVAQTTAPGPYYATPSWDQKFQCDTQATCPRFIVLSNWNNEAVLDRETGLVWQRSPRTQAIFWRAAHSGCNNLPTGSRQGWPLPTFQDLASLVDPSAPPGSKLPPGHPFNNVQSAPYWTATTDALNSNNAKFIDLSFGNSGEADKGDFLFFWCVRGGQGVEAQ
jgi:hypothetical protein